jgi:hypothetical protein
MLEYTDGSKLCPVFFESFFADHAVDPLNEVLDQIFTVGVDRKLK